MIDDLGGVFDDLTNLKAELGLPQYQHDVKLRKRALPDGALIPTETELTLTPTPCVKSVSLRLVGLQVDSNIFVGREDLEVSQISRHSITKADLLDDTHTWLIDGEPYQLIYLDNGHTLDWRVVLRRLPDQVT